MMKSALDSDAAQWEVVDLDTGEVIAGIAWANDVTSEYLQLVCDADGHIVRDHAGVVYQHVKTRRIQLRRKGEA